MAGLTNLYEQKVLDHIFTDPAWTPGATLYIALYTADPSDTGGGTEVTTAGGTLYARIATTAADWSAASGTAPAVKTNTAVKTFPQAGASWGTVVAFAICESDTEGTDDIILWGELAVDKAIGAGDTASFAASSLTIQCGDPTDTYT